MLLKQEGLEDSITYLPKPLTKKPYFIIFNKTNVDKSFVDKFSIALKEYKKTNEFKEISLKYFGK